MIVAGDLGYAYPGGCDVLEGVSFQLDKGAKLGLVGGNGSGKTTLARILCGLIRPSSGEVTVDGISAYDKDAGYEVRRKVGLVFQDPERQIVESTVEREVAFGPRNLGLEPGQVSRRVDEALGLFGIGHLRRRPCHLLSAGEKQLLAIASVFAMQPEYIMLDEPTALLDPSSRHTFIQALHSLIDATGAGVLFISMRMEDVWLCDEVMFLEDGTIGFRGTSGDLLRHMERKGMPLHGLPLLASMALDLAGRPDRLSEHCEELSVDCLTSSLIEFSRPDMSGGSDGGGDYRCP
jgi:energy-coupling factor transport system ATP-binding protein